MPIPCRRLATAALLAFAVPGIAGCGMARGSGDAPDDLRLRPQNGERPWSYRFERGIRRYEVRANDRWSGDGDAAKERSEAYAPRKLSNGGTWDVSFAMQVERGARNTAAWMTIVQLQSNFDPGEAGHSPPFAIEMKGERMRIASRWSTPLISTAADTHYTMHYNDPADIRRGHWYRMRIRVRFDPHGQGMLKVWRDRQPIVDYRGPIGFNDLRGPYFKEGVYRAPAAEPFAVRFRGLKIDRVSG